MYARVSRYRVKSDKVTAGIDRVVSEFYPLFAGATGFRAYYIVKITDDELVSFTLWDDQTSAEENLARASQYVGERLAGLVEETLQSGSGEVVLARAAMGGTRGTYTHLAGEPHSPGIHE